MNAASLRADIVIIGAGIAGASLAAEIGDAANVVLLEGEAQPGYHSTGRSAAFWSETYGGPAIQPLTTASHAYLRDDGFLTPIGAIHLAGPGGQAAINRLEREYGEAVRLERMSSDTLAALIPGLRARQEGGLAEPTVCSIDVAGLHAHYLRRARQAGVTLLANAQATAITREGEAWRVRSRAGDVLAKIVVNAAGAWAGEVAALAGARPISITPYRRTIVQIEVDPAPPADLPFIIDAEQHFYFKREANGRLWLSPHDETPSPACDAVPEEIDVATAIDRLEGVVHWRVLRVERAWAGLRSFAPDRLPVYGFDDKAPGFFWFAGQGGFGIQTAPAAAMIAASQLLGRPLPTPVAHIDPRGYAPERFRQDRAGFRSL